MRKIKVIVKRPDEKYGHVCHISDSMQNLQKTVGGDMEVVHGESFVILCDEDGNVKHYEENMTYNGHHLVGTIIVADCDKEGFTDMNITLADWKAIVDKN